MCVVSYSLSYPISYGRITPLIACVAILIIMPSNIVLYFSIIISLLTISTDFQTAYIKINEIQDIEMTDIMDEGGILTIYLKERVDSLVFQCHSDKGWDNYYPL